MRKINLNLYVANEIQEIEARKVLTEIVGVSDKDISVGYGFLDDKSLIVKEIKPKMYKKAMEALGNTNEIVYVRF